MLLTPPPSAAPHKQTGAPISSANRLFRSWAVASPPASSKSNGPSRLTAAKQADKTKRSRSRLTSREATLARAGTSPTLEE